MAALRPLAAVALLAALAGCVGGGSLSTGGLPTPGANPGSAITVNREQDGRFLSFVGPKTQHTPPFLGVPGTNYDVLRSLLDTRSGETATQIYVEDSYSGDERNWYAAQDASGKPLRFIPISKNEITCEGGCSYAEEFAASLPDALLQSSTNGLSIYFAAKSGARMTITIPAAQIRNQRAAIA
ncbi:MAG: hypothetical protein ACREFB_13970, partial [Stellaceae bacterium]